MGKVEKVIVLSVLFLIALILVVSLTVDDPLDKTHVVEAGTTPKGNVISPTQAPIPGSPTPTLTDPKQTPAVAGSDANQNGNRAPGLISTRIGTDANSVDGNTPAGGVTPTTSVAPSGLPAGALLKSLDGLQDSILPEMKLYTWQEKDSYRRIADKYYGDWTKFTVLRRSNEGRNEVQPGEQVFVPVFDSDPIVASAPALGAPTPGGPTPAVSPTPKGKKSATDSGSKKIATKAVPSGKKVHVVKNGESLWKIAHLELGDGGRWKEIYALNKDVLPSESSVHAGQTLRIP